MQNIEINPQLAYIRADECIGCTKCIQACPVDAIIGSAKQLHIVLTSECTGCGLCIPPCPVDCIEMLPVSRTNDAYEHACERAEARNQRLRNTKSPAPQKTSAASEALKQRKTYIQAAVLRVKEKKQRH